jgi:Lon protease-like protein
VGLIRACVRNPDGTSHLILEGLSRVVYRDWLQVEPFRVVRAEIHARTTPASRGELEKRLEFLRAALRRFEIRLPKELREKLARIEDPDVLLDVVSGVFLSDGDHRQSILEEPDGVRRQRLLLRLLEEIASA